MGRCRGLEHRGGESVALHADLIAAWAIARVLQASDSTSDQGGASSPGLLDDAA
jgi:hypothetical protein